MIYFYLFINLFLAARKYNHYFYEVVLPFVELNLEQYSSK